MNKHVVIHNRDNVYINLEEDDTKNLIRGHKYALKDIKKDEAIIKYGMPIGIATCDILKGDHIHTHNLKTSLGDILTYSYQPEKNSGSSTAVSQSKIEGKTVKVYERMGQEVGIRNELWIIPTVGCVNREVFDKMVAMVNDFKNYYKKHDQVIYDNPSPGNKNGGISSLEDKSLGCTTKAGDSLVVDVLKHTERLIRTGLNLISAPGNDAVATTTLGMCGCHLVLFSTGRGTPFGGFIPTVKISTNTPLFEKKPNWIDFNAGQLVDGLSMETMLEQFTEKIIDTINGAKTRQELNNYREIAIFKTGVTL